MRVVNRLRLEGLPPILPEVWVSQTVDLEPKKWERFICPAQLPSSLGVDPRSVLAVTFNGLLRTSLCGLNSHSLYAN